MGEKLAYGTLAPSTKSQKLHHEELELKQASSIVDVVKGGAFLLKVHAALLLVYVLFGGGAFISKFGIHGASPLAFELIRELITAPALLVMTRVMGLPILPERKDLFRIFLPCMCFVMNQLGFFVGLKHSDSIVATTWQTSMPVFTTLLAVLTGAEMISMRKLVGVVVATGGATFMALSDTGLKRVSGGSASGHILFAIQCCSISLSIILSKDIVKKYSAMSLTAWYFVMGSVTILFITLMAGLSTHVLGFICWDQYEEVMAACVRKPFTVPLGMIGPLIYEIVGSSIIGWFVLSWATQHAAPSVVSIYTVVQPCTSSTLSLLIIALKGRTWSLSYGIVAPGLHHLFGAALICLGLFVLLHNQVQDEKDKGERLPLGCPEAGAAHAGPKPAPDS